jgi:hypoxanthine phosphoribosyltransferase
LEPPTRPQFAHPIEEEFANILDFYSIRWVYEPRTFALEWDENGNVTLAFSPDFYLPDQDLYIELTTLRPSLANQKNYKQRRMAELYPDVSLILLKRKDLRNLMLKFGLDQQAQQIIGTAAQKGSQNE